MDVLMSFEACNSSVKSAEPKSQIAKQPAKSEKNNFKSVMNKSDSQQNVDSDKPAEAEVSEAQVKENFHSMVKSTKSKKIVESSGEEELNGNAAIIEELTKEIVDILEGFGLLNEQNGEIKLNEETYDYIFSTIGQDGTDKGEKMNDLVFGELTGTYKVDQNKNAQETQVTQVAQQIQELVLKYLSSLENSNDGSKADVGVDAGLMNVLNMEIKSKLDKSNVNTNDVDAADIDVDKLTMMLKQAVKNATGNNQAGQNETDANGNKQENVQADNGKLENVQLDGSNNPLSEAKQETVNFAEKLTQQVEVAQKDVSDNVTKIVDKMSAHVTDGKSEFDIVLKPEFLGKVSIKLVSEQGQMKALIKAGTNEARAMIADQLSVLNDSLKAKGLNVSSIEVVYDSANFDASSQHFFNQQQESGNKKGYNNRRNNKNTIESVTYDVLPGIDIPDVSIRNSSVEYSA